MEAMAQEVGKTVRIHHDQVRSVANQSQDNGEFYAG